MYNQFDVPYAPRVSGIPPEDLSPSETRSLRAGAAVVGATVANFVAGSLIWTGNGGALVIGLVVLLGSAAVGGFSLRSWSWPLLFPLPSVLMGVWLLQEVEKLNATYEATGVGSLAPVGAALLALFCFAIAAGLLVISVIAVAVGKQSARQ